MKYNEIIRILGLSIFFSLITLSIFGQQKGKISGRVTDKKTGETLIGLTVKTGGTTNGVFTDVEGRYTLSNLTPGKHSVTFTYVGYKSKTITDIEVAGSKVTTLDVVMEEAGEQLKEVVITATARQESIGTLYAKQKNSVTVSSGISAEQIRKSPDRNTSEVLKRVSGTSIQDNKFVVVRGLSDRYNSARLNNASLPSSEPDRKAFSFDIVPSNLVDNLIINKTASPDLPGDFSGGLVTINTKDFPDENFLSFGIGFGYNSQSTFKTIRSPTRSGLDVLGFDNGDRQIPEGFASRSSYNTLPLSQKLEQTKLFDNSFDSQAGNVATPMQNYQFTWGGVKQLKNQGSFGSIVSFTYRNDERVNVSHRMDYEADGHAAYDFQDDNYRYSTNVGLLANFSYKKDKSKFSFKNILNKSFDDAYTYRDGVNTDNAVARRSQTFDLVDKALVNSQIDGEHVFGMNDWKLDWNANYTFTYRDQPDLRVQSYAKPIDALNDATVLYRAEMPSGSSASRPLSRFYSRLDDYAYGVSANLSVPFTFNKEKSALKIGGSALLKNRTFDARVLGYVGATGQFDNSLRDLPADQIFAHENITESGFVLNEITNNNDRYTAIADLYSGFAMLDNRLGKKVRLVWGARAEFYNQDLDSRGFSNEKVDADVTNLDILPSFNLTYSLSEKTNFRVSGSRTVARPELRELAPFQYYDFISNSTTSGNPDLVRTKIYNGDLKYEYYPNSGEVLSGGLFYKQFNNPIEQIIPAGSNANNRLRTYANANSATNFGFELEFRKRLNFIDDSADWLKDLILFANYSYIVSDVDLSNTTSAPSEKSRALQGQSPYLINAGLQYNNSKGDFGVSMLYNRIGQRISDVGFEGYPSIYENSRDLVDLQFSKKIMKTNAELKLNFSDLLNQNIVFYQNQDSQKSFDANVDHSLNTYKPGSSISLSFTYNLRLNNR
ncbi:TonB-dependent receptor [Flavihumibacter sp. R14]|nr:TonB-dependent receptor [Flavihumibacter soli]